MIAKGNNSLKAYVGSTEVSKMYKGDILVYSNAPQTLPDYLCLTSIGTSTVSVSGNYAYSLQYSKDGASWNTLDSTVTVSLADGECMYLRGDNTRLASSTSAYTNFVMTGSIEGSGNIMSLLYSTNFDSQKTISEQYCFYRLFYNCDVLKTSPVLPATTLISHCYREMYKGCTALLEAPELSHVTSLGRGNTYTCDSMFDGCTSLTVASLPSAKTLRGYCYRYMYRDCTSLESAPDMSFTTLAGYCCSNMYYGCTSLKNVPKRLLPTTLANSVYASMFYGCSNLEAAPELPAESYGSYSYVYQQMLRNCSKISWVKMLLKTVGSNALTNFLRGAASTGIFIKHIDATWTTTGNNGVPSGWTIIYYNPTTDKYYLSDKTTECDDHGNVV